MTGVLIYSVTIQLPSCINAKEKMFQLVQPYVVHELALGFTLYKCIPLTKQLDVWVCFL